jgi:localization factor PodJL
MRAELPWNVAGIPPEAREAARAAARREGLSVGEWLTRRILRSFSGMEEDLGPMPIDSRSAMGSGLDSWGLPQSGASRRDSEDMLARVGRSESESSDAYRRIEDQLRGVARRLDSSERSHSESNRVLSRTAQEINIATREQSQAFDQLGLTVMAQSERLERLERSAANDGIKEAVKALHQGLSRLADQITQSATQSAAQVSLLAGNFEQLAARVGQARVDSEDADKALEQRLSSAEKAAQFNTNALDHALEKIEAGANQRATDQVETQRRAAQTEESLNRLEDSIARLEMRLPDAAFERRLDGIEHSVSGMVERLENDEPAAALQGTLDALAQRLDSLEKDHTALLGEMRAKTATAYEPPAPSFQPMHSYEPPPEHAALSHTEAPPFAELPPFAAFHQPAPDAFAENPAHTFGGYGAEGVDAFAPPGFGPQSDVADPFAPLSDLGPDFEDVFAVPETSDNFLTQARRSARAASEKAEGERTSRFAGFNWGGKTAAVESEAKPRSSYLIPAILALVLLVVAAAGLVLSQHARIPQEALPTTKPGPVADKGPTYSVPEPPNPDGNDGDDTQFVVAPQADSPAHGNDTQYNAPRPREPNAAPPRTALPLQQRDVRPAPVKPVSDAAPQSGHGPASMERVTQLANANNAIAQTILGLRALDGTGGAPVFLPDAVKWLTAAAGQGQAVAQYRLGTLYERGQGVTADPAKAAHWYEAAANQGNRKAMHNLAVAYAGGSLGKKNMAEAARWFAKAAALGLSDSQFNLAVLYERGDGVPQSLLDAFKWYSIAAAAGDSESKARIAVLQTQLGDADKAAANKSAATFHAAPLNRSANVPPEPADLGG